MTPPIHIELLTENRKLKTYFEKILTETSRKRWQLDQIPFSLADEKQRKHILDRLEKGNRDLANLLGQLEKEVATTKLKITQTREDLKRTQRHLFITQNLIKKIYSCENSSEISSLLKDNLKDFIRFDSLILTVGSAEFIVKRIKREKWISLVFPLISSYKTLGHLYLLSKEQYPVGSLEEVTEFLKPICDAIALSLEKIGQVNEAVQLKEEWETSFDAISDPLALMSPNYKIVRANRAYSQAAGIPIQKMIGGTCYKLLQKRSDPCVSCPLPAALRKRKMKNALLDRNGGGIVYKTWSFPLPTGNSSVQYYRDVSDERKWEAQLMESEKMAALGIVSGMIAHEINNPLGGLLAFIQVLIKEKETPEEVRQKMREIEKLALQCKKTTENLLDFARQSHPREMLPLQLSRVLDQAVELVAVYGRQMKVSLRKEYIAAKQIVFGNENQLIQVFLNLFNNGIEAIAERRQAEGHLIGHIVVRMRERKNGIVVEVSDNGCGIVTNDFRRIFSPFYSTKEKRKHAGLGLSISEAILRDHQSRVEVESSLLGKRGQGSCFRVFFPARDPSLRSG